ncbi:hypothetical protein MSG28_001438 [Choristoneura fumiferana]|uniref:Uncharacterized protein n=1 Tax=Choristoneura fumiferana TaxID=7141 RepID=A0ACC0KUN6_CHOFU|nr:hypothetical protein MSG28_001438 [Choristoneura fumiferana]
MADPPRLGSVGRCRYGTAVPHPLTELKYRFVRERKIRSLVQVRVPNRTDQPNIDDKIQVQDPIRRATTKLQNRIALPIRSEPSESESRRTERVSVSERDGDHERDEPLDPVGKLYLNIQLTAKGKYAKTVNDLFPRPFWLTQEMFKALCAEVVPLLPPRLNSRGIDPTIKIILIYIRLWETIIISIYVDDIIIACKSQEKIDNIKKLLVKRFEMRDLGEINYCLGITFERDEKQMILKQRQYIETILEKFGCKDCKPASTPMDTGLKLTKGTSPTKEKDIPYQNLIGSLMYLAVATRPDIMFAVSHLSQFNNCYTSEHFQAAKEFYDIYKELKT